MDQLRKQVARARRRLIIEQFCVRLVWCLVGSLSIAALGVAVPRIFVISGLPTNWDIAWCIGGLAAAVLAATVWTIVSNRSSLDAAMEIDRRFDLRERIASSLSLSAEEQASDVGLALVGDALRAVQRIDVDEKFRLRVGRSAWWPLVPAAIACVLVAFFDIREASSSIDPASLARSTEQTKNALEPLRKKLEEQHKKAQEKGLKDADDLFKQIEQGARDLSEKQKIDPSKAHVALNDLQKQLQERRQQLGGENALKEQLQKMKDLGAGPAEKAAQAMKEGDWNKALQEIEKLAKDIQNGKLDKAAQEKLAQQLQQLKDKLQAAADAHQQAIKDLQQQIDEQKRNGNLAKAGELQQKLDQLKQLAPQMQKLQQLAQKMGAAQQALQQANGQKAAQAMAQMAQQLAQMQKEAAELKMLDMAMDQLKMANAAMVCKNCNGKGCDQCMGMFGNGKDGQFPNGKPGPNPFGQGPGIGNRPEKRTDTATRDSQVKQNTRRGAASFDGLVEGPNIKGNVARGIQEEMATKAAEPADPLTNDRLPHSRQEQAEQYFQALRDGK